MNPDILQDLNNRGPPHLIFFKPAAIIGKKPDKIRTPSSSRLRLTQGRFIEKSFFSMYRFLILVQLRKCWITYSSWRKLLRVRIWTRPQNATQWQIIFQKDRPSEFSNKISVKWKINHNKLQNHYAGPDKPPPSPKALQCHKGYIYWGIFMPYESKIRQFINHVNDIIKYFKHFLPFGMPHGLINNEIIKLVEFTLPQNCHNQLLVQIFEYSTKSLNELVYF